MKIKVFVMVAALAAGSEAQAADSYLGAVKEKALSGVVHLALAPTELVTEPVAAGLAFDAAGAAAPIGMVIPGIPLAAAGVVGRLWFGVTNLATCLIASPNRPAEEHKLVLFAGTL